MLLIFSSNLWDRGQIIDLKIDLNFKRKFIEKSGRPSALIVICWLIITGYVITILKF